MKKIFIAAMATAMFAAPFANAQEWPRHHRDRPDEIHRKMPPRGQERPGWGPYRGRDRDGYYHGYRGYHDRRPGYRRHKDGLWYPAAAFALGAIVGGALNN